MLAVTEPLSLADAPSPYKGRAAFPILERAIAFLAPVMQVLDDALSNTIRTLDRPLPVWYNQRIIAET